MEDFFDNLSGINNVQHLRADSAEELEAQFHSIKLPTRILAIYAMGNKHYAWVQSSTKLKKVTKKRKELNNG